MRTAALLRFFALLLCGSATMSTLAADKPNILYILADDLGHGDIRALNPKRCRIATPVLDRLAAEGMIFTDAHSGSSVCTPTRYGILTGRYAWRTSLVSGVLGGFSPPLIAENRLTAAALFKAGGYHTACIGKWHLGLEWAAWGNPGERRQHPNWPVDLSRPFRRGPVNLGFDTFYGISASLDMPPFAFIEQDRLTAPPTAVKKWVREGPAAPDFEALDVLPALTARAVQTIAARAEASRSGQPFFIYLPYASPHTPIEPSPAWAGKSGIGTYGDFVMQTDACVGELLAALEKHGIADNTLVIFTSDNGCSPAAGIEALEKQGHFANGDLRGAKADIWEGGHRVPFLVRWPGKVKPGSRCATPVCLTDFMATAAEITGATLPPAAAEDSFSLLPELLATGKSARPSVIHHSIHGQFAIRSGDWKLAVCPGSGGWSQPGDPAARKQGLPARQLYHMGRDPAEQHNVIADHPAVAAQLESELQTIVRNGRSTPGPVQKNDTTVDYTIARPGR